MQMMKVTYVEEVLPVHGALEQLEFREVELELLIAFHFFKHLGSCKLCDVGHVNHLNLGVLEHLHI